MKKQTTVRISGGGNSYSTYRSDKITLPLSSYNSRFSMQNEAVLIFPRKDVSGLTGDCIQNMAMNQKGLGEYGNGSIYYGTINTVAESFM